MKKIDLNDTIAAISTPIGQAGIGIVRLSGKKSLAIADEIFVGRNGNRPSEFKTYTTHYGRIIDRNQKPEYRNQKKNKKRRTIDHRPSTDIIDEVILTIMRSPKSYTKEDIVEINCHSGIVPLRKILELVLGHGARLAEPGEFTKRAFLNGRIDLVQAESVLDIIRAKTEASLKVGYNQLSGALSFKIKEAKEEVLYILSRLEALIDFPDEDIESFPRQKILKQIEKKEKLLTGLIDSGQQGKILREGISAVICGKPNVGKSSLLNALLGEDRAIVTPIAGTTRDVIEEVINLEGVPLKITDTAGVLEPRDLIEKKAVQKSQKSLNEADLVLLLFDGSQRLSKDDYLLIERTKDKQTIPLINKIDLTQKINPEKIREIFKQVVRVSILERKGLDNLRKQILKKIWQGDIIATDEALVSNARHIDALKRALLDLQEAADLIKNRQSLELIAYCLKGSLDSLGEITGETTSEDILDRIFGEFCIGK
ncbi:MAG: tRNA uridine-5-carboxymethylaminomethyl(34) synthesis GTPase MnmE [Candidatus Omnitrophota bacterium]